jgi:hypothetical protein
MSFFSIWGVCFFFGTRVVVGAALITMCYGLPWRDSREEELERRKGIRKNSEDSR